MLERMETKGVSHSNCILNLLETYCSDTLIVISLHEFASLFYFITSPYLLLYNE